MRRSEPHWLLNDGDAKVYGQALQNALRHIPIGVAQKTVDFTALFICAFNFEIPRIYASASNARQRRQGGQPEPRGPAQVFKFRPQAATTPPAAAAAPGGSGVAGSPDLGTGVVGAVVRGELPPEPGAFDRETGEGFVADGVDGPLGGH